MKEILDRRTREALVRRQQRRKAMPEAFKLVKEVMAIHEGCTVLWAREEGNGMEWRK